MDVVLADAGYASERAYQAADDKGLRLIAPRHKNIDPRTLDPSLDPIDPDKYPATARARERLTTPHGKSPLQATRTHRRTRLRPDQDHPGPDPLRPPRRPSRPQRVAVQLRRPQPAQVHQPPQHPRRPASLRPGQGTDPHPPHTRLKAPIGTGRTPQPRDQGTSPEPHTHAPAKPHPTYATGGTNPRTV